MSKGTIFLSQEKYLRKVLDTFKMSSSKLVQLPLASYFRLYNLQCLKKEEEKLDATNILYINVVGYFIYVIVLARIDIAYAVSIVNKYMTQPEREH